MRRAESPEVVRVSESSPESSFRELDDVFLQTQARIWLAEVLHIRFDEEMAIAELLADGELLFQVSKVVWKMLLKKYPELKHSKVYIYERTTFGKSDGKYMPYPKVDSFLKICQILGLTGIDLFSPSDVVEKRDVRRVCMCIRSLSKKARLKNLRVPDFDVVTYTIVMPTDLVGGICRNLEQSQCSSSSSSRYSSCIDSREIYRQRSLSSNRAEHHDSNSESDEAESSFTELEFQSPRSNASYDAATLFSVVGNSGNSVDDENLSQIHMDFNLDSQGCREDGQKSRLHGETMLTELTDSPHACIRRNDNHDFINALHSKSLSYSRCQTYQGARKSSSQMGDIKYPDSHKSGEQIHGADINSFQTCASCFEDSTSGSDKKLNVNREEASEGYVGSMLMNIHDNNLICKCTTSNTHTDLDNEEEDFAKAYGGGHVGMVNDAPGEDEVRFECMVQQEAAFSDCYTNVLEYHDRKSSSDTTEFLDGEYGDLPPSGCISVAGNEEIKHAENFVNRKTSPADLISHQASVSDLSVYSMENSNFLNSDSVVPGGHLMGFPKHKSVTDLNFHDVKSQIIENEGELKNYLIEQDGSCFCPREACKHLVVEIKPNLPEKQCTESLNCYTQGGSISDFSNKSSSQWVETESDDECRMSSSKIEDSCVCQMKPLSSSCRESSRQLSAEETTIRHSHSTMPNDMLAICDFESSCQLLIQQAVLDASGNTFSPMGNDIMQRKTSGSLGIDCMDRSEFYGSETRGTQVTEKSKAPCTHYPNEIDGSEFVDTQNAGPESPGQGGYCKMVSMDESAGYNSISYKGNSKQFQDSILRTEESLPFSAPGCAVEGAENICIEQSSEVRYQTLPLIDDVGVDDADRRKKDREESEKELVTTLDSSGKSRDGTTGKMPKPGKRMLKSVAGGITLAGALFLLLHLRRKRDKEKSSTAVVPLQTPKAGMEGSIYRKVEISKPDGLYPGERLKF